MAEDTSSSNRVSHSRSVPDLEGGHLVGSDHGISINLPPGSHDGRPPAIKHMSAPAYQSPIRHHRRTPSRSKGVKETLDARSHYGSSDDDGAAVHRINQYIIKQEIGRGSFGAVHLAVDQYGHEFAVKEFSKSRLRKRAQSNLLRKPNQGRKPGQLAAGLGFNSPMHRINSDKSSSTDDNNSLELIKEEIAIMKKLDHNNLVSLIEVLDDPQEDSLYMVLEMCKKGVAMKVGLDERAEPYNDETCRCWFRDMILGIEYLHAQGIIHRDIKPDNCLITDDDVLKIVDFGVSEMFEKQSEMATAKSAGSPAFMPPELCVARHGQISGRAADIWSMGVTLYCLRYGHIPFEKGSMIELYDSIRGDAVPLDEEKDSNFADLIKRMLEKDPEKRIGMEELRDHPWVTKDGTDPLLSREENCADLIEPPTEAEMDHAITGNMAHLLAVMKAVKRFKKSASDKRGRLMDGILGRESRLTAPPHSMQTKSQDTYDRRPINQLLVTDGVHQDLDVDDPVPEEMEQLALFQSPEMEDAEWEKKLGETEAHYKQRIETIKHHPESNEEPEKHQMVPEQRARTFPVEGYAKGHAHDPLEDTLFLNIGHDPDLPEDHFADCPMVSESPGAVDINIYEQAYQEEMQRILERRGREPSIYMTRRVEHREDIRALNAIKDAAKYAARSGAAKWANKGYSVREISDNARLAARESAGKFSERWLSGAANAPDDFEGKDASSKGRREYAREYLEPWKQSAKSAATAGYDSSLLVARSAQERLGALYARTGSTSGRSGSWSGLLARTSSNTQGEPSDPAAPNGGESFVTAPQYPEEEPTETSEARPSPPSIEVQDVKPTPPLLTIPRKPVPHTKSSERPVTPTPLGDFPVTPSAEEPVS